MFACSQGVQKSLLISMHGRVSELQTFVYVAVMKESTDDLSSVNLFSFSNRKAYLEKKLYLGGFTNSWRQQISQVQLCMPLYQ